MLMHPSVFARVGAALLFALVALALCDCKVTPMQAAPPVGQAVYQPSLTPTETGPFDHEETRRLVALVNDAAELVHAKGEGIFADFRTPGSKWRHEDTYVFVLDLRGDMLVHPDPTIEGRNQLALQDVRGKPIVRGLLAAATALPSKPEGWYHYEWPVPGGLLPRWKSTYVRLVVAPSGKGYVVGSGMYDDRMERSFVIDEVRDAVGLIEKDGSAAFDRLRDPRGPFIAKDAYVFVVDPRGVELVNPAFPNLEGRNLLDVKDAHGKRLVREMLAVAQVSGSGWVDYMWPKPGESVPTQKTTYVSKARMGGSWLLVGCGVYLADAPRGAVPLTRMTASDLMSLVREAAALLAQRGEAAYPEMRRRGSKWLRDDTYFFVWSLDGTRVFHAADPSLEGQRARDVKDIRGRPYGEMFLAAASAPAGEGWVHYMYPEPDDIFPAWKSAFIERVTFPSGKRYLVGSAVYDMQMDTAFIEDVVDRAAALVAERGREAFAQLRDPTGPFVFMDTYVFVDTADGIELVNAAQPSLEGAKVVDLTDLSGKALAREYIDLALKSGGGWVDYVWYKPGTNRPARKQAFVRKVQSGSETFIVGSGLYIE